jgi:DNA repair protein RecO (recombination protein O)
MATEKATALVVRGTDWSETSRITTLFTREFGKVRALAKGGRRLKSSFDCAFDLLSVCDVVFIHKAHGGLDLLTEARLVEKFVHLRSDLNALYAGYYVAELLADGTADMDPHPNLYDAAVATLAALADGPVARAGHVLAFELEWLSELGYSPRLEDCAACGNHLPTTALRVAYSPTAGGGVCPDCTLAAADRRWISTLAWQALREMATGRPATPLPPPIRHELRGLMGQTICDRLAKRPRLLSYIEADPG